MDRAIKSDDGFLDKLYKLLPAEITAVFLAIRSVIEVADGGQSGLLGAWLAFWIIVLLTVITPFVLAVFGVVANLGQRVFMGATFFIWAVNIDISSLQLISPPETIQLLGMLLPILLILWAGIAWPTFAHFSKGQP